MVGPMRKSLLSKAVTAVCATVMCLGVTACGGNSSAKSDKSNSDSSSSSEKIGMHQIAGVTAKGELGKKPTVSFKTPMTVEDNSYVVLQKGDGAQIEDGDRVCSQGIAISVKDGSELASTWEKNTPDCSTVVTSDTSQMTENYYKIFKSLKLNSTVAFGVNDSNSSGTSYLMVLTLVSKSKDLKKATGEKVAGVLSSPVAAALPSPAEAGSFASVGVPDEHPASMATAIASAMSSAMLFFAVISIPPCVVCAFGEMLMFCDDFTSSQFTQGFTKNQYVFRRFSTGFRMLKHRG